MYAIARRHGLRVLEDAAQSIGASCDGTRVGAGGDLVAISFQANKNLTTAEGGCLVMNDAAEARRCELWRLQGVERFADGTMDATLPGGKYNMTDVAARLGIGQLARLAEFTARRRALARRYLQVFDRALGCELPLADFEQSNCHMFQIVLPPTVDRGAFIHGMHAAGIGVGVHCQKADKGDSCELEDHGGLIAAIARIELEISSLDKQRQALKMAVDLQTTFGRHAGIVPRLAHPEE